MTTRYKLRFFFDYGCCGCLWTGDDRTFEKYGVGVLDGVVTDLNGNIIQEAKIDLPTDIKANVARLDALYYQSLDWNNPGGASLWSKAQWDSFHIETRKLFEEISQRLRDDFDIAYMQEEDDGNKT